VRRVLLAEKLENARSALREYRAIGDELWRRRRIDAGDFLWYLRELAKAFRREHPGALAEDLAATVAEIERLVASPEEQA
jgi:hypothetical protein